MRVVGDSGEQLVQRVGEILVDDPEAAVVVTVPGGLDEDETLALCATLAALGVADIHGTDAKIVRRCLDTARAVQAGEIGAVAQ